MDNQEKVVSIMKRAEALKDRQNDLVSLIESGNTHLVDIESECDDIDKEVRVLQKELLECFLGTM